MIALLTAAVLCSGTVLGVSAAGEQTASAASISAGEQVEARAAVNTVALTQNGKTLTVSARLYDGQLMVPLGAFANLFTDATYSYNKSTCYATLTAPGLTLTAGVGGSFLTANDRCLYGVALNRLIDGTVWVPLRPLAKAMSLTLTYQSGASSAAISGSYKALTHAKSFYNADELYWLSRIISAESRGEPLRGQMAVGNVILNRVRSRSFPNTIYGVIFQKSQFSPVSNGTIYNSPAWVSVCAAKMCLEGYSISNDVLFFCNLSASPNNWVVKNRQAAFKIGSHTFFL